MSIARQDMIMASMNPNAKHTCYRNTECRAADKTDSDHCLECRFLNLIINNPDDSVDTPYEAELRVQCQKRDKAYSDIAIAHKTRVDSIKMEQDAQRRLEEVKQFHQESLQEEDSLRRAIMNNRTSWSRNPRHIADLENNPYHPLHHTRPSASAGLPPFPANQALMIPPGTPGAQDAEPPRDGLHYHMLAAGMAHRPGNRGGNVPDMNQMNAPPGDWQWKG